MFIVLNILRLHWLWKMVWIIRKFTRPTRIALGFDSETLLIDFLIRLFYCKLWKLGRNLSSWFQIMIQTAKWHRYPEVTHHIRYAHRATATVCLFCLGKFMGCFSEVKGSVFVMLTRLQAHCFSWDVLSLASNPWIIRQRKPCQNTLPVS